MNGGHVVGRGFEGRRRTEVQGLRVGEPSGSELR